MLKKNYIKKILLLLIPVLFLAAFKPKEKIHTVLLKTKYGTMRILLYNETPKHRDNFLKLTNEHFYDSLLFHRVIKDFMIQGGDPDSKHAKAGQMLGNGDVGYYVDAEFRPNLFHKKGVIAAARDENPTKASSGCQFYIVQGKKFTDADLDKLEQQTGRKIPADQREVYKTIGGTPHLDQGYTVYGEVIEGLNVLDSIASVKCDKFNRPLEDVRIISITQGKDYKPKKVKH
ncbi:MAG TPA: peptidylprolyl isomerase [Bacteroidetes bacterium]|nr:peptidylprolyl isomerase [Bacteroidota bacterium]